MAVLHADRLTLATETHGSGTPLVFLHGGWTDRSLWAPQTEYFADDYRAISVDLRDHGESKRAVKSYSVREMAADVARVLDDVAEPAVVCGLSLGGLVAQRLAHTHPDRVAGLVLADTVTSIPPVDLPPAVKQYLLPKAGTHFAVRSMGVGAYYRLLLNWVESLECQRWLALDDEVREYALAAIDEFDVDRFIRVFDALYDFEPVDNGVHDTPALVLHGDHEPEAVVHQNRQLARTLGADRRVVPEAGHLSNRDNHARFNAMLEGFLADVVTAGR